MHMMVSCLTEVPAKGSNPSEPEVKYPGLELLLQYKPNLEIENLQGRTPLVMTTLDKASDKIKILVRRSLKCFCLAFCVIVQ